MTKNNQNKLNLNSKISNSAGLIFLIFLNYYFYFNNFTSAIPGRYLLLICLLINLVLSLKFDFLNKHSLYLYILISLTITNILFNEAYLLSFRTFEPFHLLNVLSISCIVPIFLKNLFFKNFYVANILFSILIFENLPFFLNRINFFKDNSEIYLFLFFILIIQIQKSKDNVYFILPFLLISIFLNFFVSLFAIFYFLQKEKITKQNHLIILFITFGFYIFSYSGVIIQSLKLNIDNYVFFFTGLRSNYLSEPVYFGAIDNKGFFLFEIYKYLSKFASLLGIEQWNYIFIGLCIFLIIFIYIFNKVSAIFENSLLIKLPLILLVMNDVLFDVDKTVRFGARLIGSLLILIGIYFIINKNLFVGSIFLTLSNFVLISFIIPTLFIVLFLLFEDKKNLVFIKYLLINLSVITLYLFLTNQLDYYFLVQIEFLLSASSQGLNTNLFLRFMILYFLPFSLIFLSLKNNFLNDKEKFISNIFLIWLSGEVFHLFLTNARYSHYKNLLIIPTVFVISIFFLNLKEIRFYGIKLVILVIILNFLVSDNLPKHYQPHVNISSLNTFEKKEPVQEKDNKYGVYLTFSADDFSYYYDNYKIIPSTKAWVLVATDNDISSWVSGEEILEYFFQDYSYENPKYLIINNETYEDLNNLQLFSKLKDEFELIECYQETCLYNKLS